MKFFYILLIILGISQRISPQKVQNELTRKIDELMISNQKLQASNQKLELSMKNIQTNPPWPKGHYCIFKSGTCPLGFIEKSGHMKAIGMYSGVGWYFKENNFGDSRISCHQSCSKTVDNWHGEFVLVTCCK